MNILTKICVVILLVLVLFASFTFVNMATVPQNWRNLYQQKKQEATLNAQAVRYQKLLNTRLSEELKDVRDRADTLAVQLADTKKGLVPGPEDLGVKEMAAQLQAANTRLAELQLNVEAMAKRNDRLVAQLDETRKTVDDLQKLNRRATGEITQLRGKLERSERVVRALQRQLQDRDERIAELEKQLEEGAGVADTARPGAPATGHITGTITAVRDGLASINVGSAQGVSRGTKLYIYRDASFVGYLRVDEVDEGEAAGTIIDKQLDPVIGDKVTNDLLK